MGVVLYDRRQDVIAMSEAGSNPCRRAKPMDRFASLAMTDT
jgi:hypothetical protein